MSYKPLEIETVEVAGFEAFREAVGKPVNRESKELKSEIKTGSVLVKRGDEHAKSVRALEVWFKIKMQVGFMIEFDTYRIGIDCLSTTSSMHGELADLKGIELAKSKQNGLADKVYTRIFKASYQTLRRIYKQRQNHRHPDWLIFCEWVENLPYFGRLISPD